MMVRRTAFGGLGAGLIALLPGCGLSSDVYRFRFRMTVEVNTPLGPKSGSSVYEVSARDRFSFTPEMADRAWSLTGESVVVDVSEGKTLFALLKSFNHRLPDLALISLATLDPKFENDIAESAKRIANGNGVHSQAEVQAENYPILVIFADINDPTTVERVDPANLEVSFGHGVHLKRVIIEVTDVPVTNGIEKRLPWLEQHLGSLDYTGRLHPENPEKDLTPSAIWEKAKQ